MNVVCWNCQWQGPASWKGAYIASEVQALEPEIVCLPEVHIHMLGQGWHRIHGGVDPDYRPKNDRRKITLWSRQPWDNVDDFGSEDLPPGRFVRGTTATSLGLIDVIGICIPWSMCHVTGGRKDRRPWEDHIRYLDALQDYLAANPFVRPTILLGDFNQRIPRATAPRRVYDRLMPCLDGFALWTGGEVPGLEKQPVCHIAGTDQLQLQTVRGLSRGTLMGNVSDHDGVYVAISPT